MLCVKVLSVLFLNLCFIVKSDGTMKQGHQQRRNLGGPAPKQLWRSHVRGQIHGQGTGRACSRQAEQSRAVWGAQGRRGRQAGM